MSTIRLQKRRRHAQSSAWTAFLFLLVLLLLFLPTHAAQAKSFGDRHAPMFGLAATTALRGGGTKEEKKQAFYPLAEALLPYLTTQQQSEKDAVTTTTARQVTKALVSLASSQSTLKGLDGMAHEAYQRTHTAQDISLHVSGRAMRTVARTQAVAIGLGACELCELAMQSASRRKDNDDGALSLRTGPFANGVLADKEILLQETITVKHQTQSLNVTVLVLYEPQYRGGGGVEHANVFRERPAKICHGRILIALGTDDATIGDMLPILALPAQLVPLKLTQQEAASVQPMLYRAASQVLQRIETTIQPYNTSAIHIVGHSLAGGVATLLATLLEGHLAPQKVTKGKRSKMRKKSKKSDSTSSATKDKTNNVATDLEEKSITNTTKPVEAGWGRSRTSCCALGAPPSLSANVPTDTLVTNIVYGDDWVCRTTEASLKRLIGRIQPLLKRNTVLKQAALLSDSFKLAAQGLSAHAHGREGEECRLTSATGSQSYLLRPRRYGNHVSIHEMGRASGREAIRAAVLWQLSDIMISPSYAMHHRLHSYIHGLDRVHMRGLDDTSHTDEEELERKEDDAVNAEEDEYNVEDAESSEAESDEEVEDGVIGAA